MNIQFKKGVLEMCVMSLLADKDRYGYEIAAALSRGVGISDGTVYPILRRLKQDGYLTSYLEEASGGPARKYYSLAPPGREFLALLMDEWQQLNRQINGIVSGGEKHD